MKSRGFTLIELMIIIAIVGIAITIALPVITGHNTTSNASIGMNGVVEERCIGGYKFVVGHRGQPTQILNEMGKGVPCN